MMNTRKPGFAGYYFRQVLVADRKRRRICPDGKTGKLYAEARAGLHEALSYGLFAFAGAVLLLVYKARLSDDFLLALLLCGLAVVLLAPLRYFFVRFEQITKNVGKREPPDKA